MQQILAAAEDPGTAFQGPGGEALMLVQQGTTARNITVQFQVPGTATWVNDGSFTASNASGHHTFTTSKEIMYRLNPASAGPNAWLVQRGQAG